MPKQLMFHNEFGHYPVTLVKSRYVQTKQTAIQALDDEGCPAFTATVALADAILDFDEIAVKDYSENKGVLAFLRENGIVTDIARWERSGFVNIPICKVDLKRLDELTK